jgi:uncharacterized Zn finger protein
MTAPPASAPPKSFRAECPKCGKLATHEEFFRERRAAGSPQAAARGDYKTQFEWSFRCSACGQRNEKLLDEQGLLHKWQGNRHVAVRIE